MDFLLHMANCHGEWSFLSQTVVAMCDCLPFLNGFTQALRSKMHAHDEHV